VKGRRSGPSGIKAFRVIEPPIEMIKCECLNLVRTLVKANKERSKRVVDMEFKLASGVGKRSRRSCDFERSRFSLIYSRDREASPGGNESKDLRDFGHGRPTEW